MSYTNPTTATYTLKAVTLSTAAALLTVMGPSGMTGRVKAMSFCVTTSTTTAATELRVGTAADADDWATASVPVATAGAASASNTFTDNTSDSNLITADTALIIATDGGCAAGAADISVTIDWFKN